MSLLEAHGHDWPIFLCCTQEKIISKLESVYSCVLDIMASACHAHGS